MKQFCYRCYLPSRMAESEHFRADTRRSIVLPVRFRTGAALEQRGKTADIGVSGAFITCERPPSIGTMVLLELRSPTAWDPLNIECEVRWINDGIKASEGPRGFGVRFDGLAPTAAAALYDFVHTLDFEAGA